MIEHFYVPILNPLESKSFDTVHKSIQQVLIGCDLQSRLRLTELIEWLPRYNKVEL